MKPTQNTKPDYFITGWFVLIHLVALIAPWYFFSWSAVAAAVVLYFLTVLGITLGYHRLLTHRSFKAPKFVERLFATFGLLALQRSPVEWVGHHRMHHAHVDTAKDPHDATRGFWWSHIGWMCVDRPEVNDINLVRKYARDIVADPFLNAMTNPWVQVLAQVALGFVLLALGGWSWVVWGIFVRLVAVYHVTWFVNSACHMFGYRNYESKDISTNCWWVGLLACGEGWHNNHHAQQDVAPAGRRWWEFDITWQVIKLLKAVGGAYDVRMPSPVVTIKDRPVASGSGLTTAVMEEQKD